MYQLLDPPLAGAQFYSVTYLIFILDEGSMVNTPTIPSKKHVNKALFPLPEESKDLYHKLRPGKGSLLPTSNKPGLFSPESLTSFQPHTLMG